MMILQVNSSDIGGGAEKVARTLHAAYRSRGHRAVLAVGYKQSTDPSVLPMSQPPKPNIQRSIWWNLQRRLIPWERQSRIVGYVRNWLQVFAGGWPEVERELGREDFHFSGGRQLLALVPDAPDVIQLHNLHGGYFDLRTLKMLCRQYPVFITLHDEWMFTGHCGYTLGCERWQLACGQCPDLSIYPSIRRDATRWNRERKRRIYKSSKLHVVTPSRWLADRVNRSILSDSVVRVIPNGIDLTIFAPGDKAAARCALSLDPSALILLFVANRGRLNPFKDYTTIDGALRRLPIEITRRIPIVMIILGDIGHADYVNGVTVKPVSHLADASLVARYYQAADILVHSARSDNFPTTIMEAMACGTPVVASAVGGISEQVDNGETGYLFPSGDVEALTQTLIFLIRDSTACLAMGARAASHAKSRFGLDMQVDAYLAWYQEVNDSVSQRVPA